jgi:hypothetical protein
VYNLLSIKSNKGETGFPKIKIFIESGFSKKKKKILEQAQSFNIFLITAISFAIKSYSVSLSPST